MIFITFWIFWTSLWPATASANSFSIYFSNIKQPYGAMYISVYNRSDAFMQIDQAIVKKIVPVQQSGGLSVTISEISTAGQYAVSAFHDLNGDGKMNTNLMGIPTEPYGFSNNARPRFRAPRWSEAQVYWQPGQSALNVRMEKW